MELNLLPKQKLLISSGDVSTVVYGGARGGGKSYGAAAAMALEIIEWHSESEAKEKNLNLAEYRTTEGEPGWDEIFYFKYIIDYPEYRGVFVRRTEPALRSQTHTECRKIFPFFGGKWSNERWTFPSGAEIEYRPCNRREHLDWFQGQNLHRLCVEELTQFDENEIEEMESCCRSAHPLIRAKKIYTTNPGKRGHRWVYQKYIKNAEGVPDGEPIYLPEFDLTYQPLKPNKVQTNVHGERYLFIPSLVFDNEYLSKYDKEYIRNLMTKNEILKQMWLFGNWNVFAGQFFTMWREEKHVRSELDFYGAKDYSDLVLKRKHFDWSDYRLLTSQDYGFAEGSAWACGFYAQDSYGDLVKFYEIVRSGLTIHQQAEETKRVMRELFGLKPDDFCFHIADPLSYWQRREKNENEFWDFARAYQEHGITLTKGINDRQQGAMATLEALRIRDDGTPRITFLDCCLETTTSIPDLPADPKNPNDVDTTAYDHCYDELRYLLMHIIGTVEKKKPQTVKDDWRKRVAEIRQQAVLGTYEGRPKSWRVA